MLRFFKDLSDFKIVFGNGFDLYCGLASSYKDFFEKSKKSYNDIETMNKKIEENYIIYDGDMLINNVFDELLNKTHETVWDLIFYYSCEKIGDEIRWCDIEKVMRDFLFSDNDVLHLNKVLLAINDNDYVKGKYRTSDYFYIVAKYLSSQYEMRQYSRCDLIEIFYKELKIFEKSFSNYLCSELQQNIAFNDRAMFFLSDVVGLDSIKVIDTFNYIELPFKFVFSINNINGNLGNRIFGIDTKGIKKANDLSIFEKGNRRTFYAMKNESIEYPSYSNVMIFGSSLNEQDYSSFFVFFDDINLMDDNSKSHLIFCYYIYNQNEKDLIKENFKDSVISLINAYEDSKNNPEENRLYSKLITRKRLLFQEIFSQIYYLNN